jgi:single-strand DNA-binding protein
MGSLNRVQLIGNLGRDPELRYTADGTPVCNFSMATAEAWTTKAGEKQEKTEWHRISLWGKLGEIAGQYLKKGRQVYIEGSIRSREYTDKEGLKKTAYEIRADRMVMLSGGRPEGAAAGMESGDNERPAYQKRAPAPRAAPTTARETASDEPPPNFNDDDIPF